MLIQTVHARAFGPLVDETLSFADGMTVVYGPNESAKSSWHAAIYAALCGRRRGRAASAEERHFADMHRPWDSRTWVVGAEVVLDDGRRLEVRQDLSGKVDCDVRDLGLGRDCSAEFLVDGTPDLTRWLGLDRHSFLATAFVAQAQVLAVHARAGGLQQQLQRAAATAGADQTAALALDHIDSFRRDRVGSERAPARPLRRAEAAMLQAQAALDNARANHAAYQDALIELVATRAAATEADRRLRLHEAVAMTDAALALRARVEESVALQDRLGDPAPTSEAADADIAEEVAAALAAWDALADGQATMLHVATSGPGTIGQDAIGDDAIGQDVIGPDAAGPGANEDTHGVASDGELWELAGALGGAPRLIDPAVDERVLAARARFAKAERARLRGRRLVVAASVVGLIAAALLVLGAGDLRLGAGPVALGVRLAGIAGTGCALLLGALGLRALRTGGDSVAAHLEVEASNAAADRERMALARRDSAMARVARLGLPPDPATLRELARSRAGQLARVNRDREWLGAIERSRRRAAERIILAARRCDITPSSAEDAVPRLRRWQSDRDARAAALEAVRSDRARLESLLRGRSVANLLQAAAQAEATARRGRFGFSAGELASVGVPGEAALAELRARARAADNDVSLAEGARKALETHLFGSSSPVGRDAAAAVGDAPVAGRGVDHPAVAAGVAEAEEELVRAESDLHRLRELDATLELTRRFLAVAQERAHRTIAPVLVNAIGARLPDLTAGRYTQVTVDPENLRVQVRGPLGRWREADTLSRGTAEQIYLLLRIALAQHLARPGTSCPLVLDEVTAHADAQRTTRILDQLLSASQDRQIILFTQQNQVRDWARAHLDSPHHALRELETVTIV